MQAAEIMSHDPVVVASSADVYAAAKLMEENDIRHLPVVDDGELVGVLSERNVLEASGWAFPASGRDVSLVRDSMHIPVEVAHPDEEVRSVCERLVEWRIGCLPVVDGGDLVGIVTDVDVMRVFLKLCEKQPSAPGTDPEVSARMTREVVTIERDAPVRDAIEILKERRIRHLPVVEGDRAIGMLSDRDIRLCIGRGLPLAMPCSGMATPDLCTISPARRLSEAAEVLLLRKIGALPVVEDDRLVGMLSSMDILEHCASIDW